MDEFYTAYADVQNELTHYLPHFKNKVVWLPCDNPDHSNFYKWFDIHFNELGLLKLITSSFPSGLTSIKTKHTETWLNAPYGGDYAKQKQFLHEADIVVTNPPFSKLDEFLELLIKYNKKFIVLCPSLIITRQKIWKLFFNRKFHLGWTRNKAIDFQVPLSYPHKVKNGLRIGNAPNVTFFTNLPLDEIELKQPVGNTIQKEFFFYDNFPALHVINSASIPQNYDGLMGVPLSFLNYFDERKFSLIGMLHNFKRADLANGMFNAEPTTILRGGKKILFNGAVLHGEAVFTRLLVKRK